MFKSIFATTALALTLSIFSAHAGEETSAMASPKCDADKLQEIGGDGVVKVEQGAWAGGYNVTLNTDELTFADLTAKMAEEGCF